IVQIASAAARYRSVEILSHTRKPVGVMRSFGQGWRTDPLPLFRIRAHDEAIVCDSDMAVLAIDFDRIGAPIAGPCHIDVPGAGNQIEGDGCRVLERPRLKTAPLEHCGDP